MRIHCNYYKKYYK